MTPRAHRSCSHPAVRVVVAESATQSKPGHGSEPQLACVACGAFMHHARREWGPPHAEEAADVVAGIADLREDEREGLALRFSEPMPVEEALAAARGEWHLWLRARPHLWLLYGVAVVRERYEEGAAPVLEMRRDECALGPRL